MSVLKAVSSLRRMSVSHTVIVGLSEHKSHTKQGTLKAEGYTQSRYKEGAYRPKGSLFSTSSMGSGLITSYVDHFHILTLQSCSKARSIGDCDMCPLLPFSQGAQKEGATDQRAATHSSFGDHLT